MQTYRRLSFAVGCVTDGATKHIHVTAVMPNEEKGSAETESDWLWEEKIGPTNRISRDTWDFGDCVQDHNDAKLSLFSVCHREHLCDWSGQFGERKKICALVFSTN